LSRTGSTYRVHVEGREIAATLRGKLKHKDDDRVVVGDVVLMDLESPDSGAITGITERRTVLERRAAGQGASRAPPIARNVGHGPALSTRCWSSPRPGTTNPRRA